MICSGSILHHNLTPYPITLDRRQLQQLEVQLIRKDYYHPYFEFLNAGEVYCITNQKTGQKYIGQTKCVKMRLLPYQINGEPIAKYDLSALEGRHRQHMNNALGQGKNKNDCKKFYEAIRQDPDPTNWQLSIVIRCHLFELNKWEKHYVKYYKCRRQGYNMVSGGKKKTSYYAKKYHNRKK